MAKRNNNRVAPPRLEPEAGWTQADQDAYHEADPEAAVAVAELPANSEIAAETPPPVEGIVRTISICMCQGVLGNLAVKADGYRSRHIDLQLSPGEQEIIARLRAGLIASHAQLVPKSGTAIRGGKHVESANDAVRWLIQQVAGLSIAAAGS